MQLVQFKNQNRHRFIAAMLVFVCLHSLPFHQLPPHRVNKGSNLMVEPDILLQSEADFSTFYIGLHFTCTVARVNLYLCPDI